jgi:hypothetical protein
MISTTASCLSAKQATKYRSLRLGVRVKDRLVAQRASPGRSRLAIRVSDPGAARHELALHRLEASAAAFQERPIASVIKFGLSKSIFLH